MTDTNALIAQIIRDNLSGPMFDEPDLRADHQKDIENTAALIIAALTPAPREDGYSAGVRAAVAWLSEQPDAEAWVMSEQMERDLLESRQELPGTNADPVVLAPALPDARAGAVEPVAVRYGFDVDGWLYADNGNGSDWLKRAMAYPDADPLYAAPPTPACTATDGPASACVYRAPGLGTNEYGDDIPGRIDP